MKGINSQKNANLLKVTLEEKFFLKIDSRGKKNTKNKYIK